MKDRKGDGWNGNILAVKQQGLIITTFGANFARGFIY